MWLLVVSFRRGVHGYLLTQRIHLEGAPYLGERKEYANSGTTQLCSFSTRRSSTFGSGS